MLIAREKNGHERPVVTNRTSSAERALNFMMVKPDSDGGVRRHWEIPQLARTHAHCYASSQSVQELDACVNWKRASVTFSYHFARQKTQRRRRAHELLLHEPTKGGA